MIDKIIGINDVYVVSGNCGKEFNEELKKLKKQLKEEGRKIDVKIVTKAIIVTKSL